MSNSVNLSLDITKTGIQNPLIKVRQGDGGFETLHTTVTANGEPMDLQGWTITFMGTTAGNHKIVDANVTVVEAPNGIFEYTPSKAWGMDIGDFKIAYFKFVKGDGSASSANFRVNVIEAVDLTQEEAQNYISVVDATIAEVNNHLNTVSNNLTALGNRINDYNSKLAALQVGGRNLIIRTDELVGKIIGANGAIEALGGNSAMKNPIAVKPGEQLTMNGTFTGSESLFRYGFYDADGNLLTRSFVVVTNKTTVTAPAGSSTFRISYPTNSQVKLERGNVATDWTPAPEDLSVGGRNLLLDTGRSFTGVGNGSTNGNFDAQGGVYYLVGSKQVSDLYKQYGSSRYLTLSFDWVASGDAISGSFNPIWSNTPWGFTSPDVFVRPSVTNKSGRYKVTVPLSAGGYSTGVATTLMFRQDNLQGNVTISNVKLEVGNVATDWTPAPEDLFVGGRNLMLGSADWSGGGARWNLRATAIRDTYRGTVIAATTRAWNNTPVYVLKNAGILQKGKTYTFSTYVRNTSDTDVKIGYYYEAGMMTPSFVDIPLPAHTDWTRIFVTFQLLKDTTASDYGLRWEIKQDVTNGEVQFAGYKLEEGNVPTDWTPAPEDIENAYVKKSGDTMTGGLKGGQVILPDAGDLNTLTDTGKYYQTKSVNAAKWSNRPSNAPDFAFSVDVIGNESKALVTQTYYVHTTSRAWVRTLWVDGSTMAASAWVELANDANVVHKTGNETVAGDKTFTGNVSIPAVTSVATRTVSGTNGMSFKFRRTGNAVHIEISGNYTGTNWTSSAAPSYATELFNVVVPAGFAPDDWTQSAIIEYGSAVGFGRYGYDSSSRKMTFTFRGMVGVVGSSKWIVSSTTYTTGDAFPG